MSSSAVLDYLARDREQALARLSSLLAIPSVSTDPAYAPQMQEAAGWVGQTLRDLGLETTVHATAGHPIVLARSAAEQSPPGAPRVLFYGHYDVQPPDPLEGWTTAPFTPTIRAGAIYARGASDDKGQVCCFLEALRAWRLAGGGKFPAAVTVLIEGEEECGSVHLDQFLQAHKSELAADIVLISDTTMWNRQTPAIIYGLRGLLYFDLKLHGPNRDLHSGVYGGTLANPATMLTQVLGRLFDDQHRVTVPGFYDDVPPPAAQERQQWAQLGFDEMRDFLGPIGVTEPFGEAGFATLERRWVRPACDINGLYGGYGGEGAKTVIPRFAGAKVSFRLAPQQQADKIAAAFRAWVEGQPVHGCRWQISEHGRAEPVVLPVDSPFLGAARAALERAAGKAPVLVREGATIPVIATFKKMLGLNSLLVGFGLDEDRIHSPNEKFDLECFYLGCRTHAVLLEEIARIRRA